MSLSESKIPEDAAGTDVYERLKQDNELIATISRCANDGMVILKGDVIIDANRRAREMFSPESGRVIGLKPWQVGRHPDYSAEQLEAFGREYVARAYDGEVVRFESASLADDDSLIFYDVVLSRFRLRDGPRLLGWVRAVTTEHMAKDELEKRIAYQSKVVSLSNELVSAQPSELGHTVRRVLGRVSEGYGIERAGVWAIDRERDLAYGTLSPVDDDSSDPIIIRQLSLAPWIVDHALTRQSQPAVMPDEVPEHDRVTRGYLTSQGIRSSLLIPLVRGDRVGGVASFSMTTASRHWSRREKTELQLIAQVIGLSWLRFMEYTRTVQRERDLARSQQIAEVGSFQIIPTDPSPLSWGNAKILQSVEADRIRGPVNTSEAMTAMLDPVHRDDHARLRRALADIERLDEQSPMVFRIRKPTGETLTVEKRFVIDRDDHGKITRVFGTVKNVTEQVNLTRKLQVALDEISRLKEKLEAENVVLRKEVRSARGMERIIGRSQALRDILLSAKQVATTGATVLVLGETGTGKELIAQTIHDLSDKSQGPLVSVNCAALSSELIESELFGHEKGAFTNAIAMRKGRFELAHGGTLFLDEIGELPLGSQAKLLRALQSGEFERIGGTRTIEVDVRIIAATNSDLEGRVEDGSFRSDLFYRINQFPIELPPLRDRKEDIPLLANHFMLKYAKSFGKNVTSISDAMIDEMMQKEWRGNIRELEGHIQRGMIAADGSVLDYQPREELRRGTRVADAAGSDEQGLALDSMQRRHIRAALESCKWRISGENGAAVALGIPASSLRSKMKRLGIQRPGR